MPSIMTPEQYQGYCYQFMTNSHPKNQQFFLHPTLSNSQYSFTEYPNFVPQVELHHNEQGPGFEELRRQAEIPEKKKREKNVEK